MVHSFKKYDRFVRGVILSAFSLYHVRRCFDCTVVTTAHSLYSAVGAECLLSTAFTARILSLLYTPTLQIVGAACLFLAGKAEETAKRIKDIIYEYYFLRHCRAERKVLFCVCCGELYVSW
jgi:cyclin-like protein